MLKKIYNLIMQIAESYVMFFTCFFIFVFLNNLYSRITFLDFNTYQSLEIYLITPLLILVISKMWYLFFEERHSFIMIFLNFAVSSYFMYQFGGLQDFLWFVILKANLLTKMWMFLLSLLIIAVEFVFISIVLAHIHSLFTDRIQMNNLGGKNHDNCKSKKC